MLKLLELVVCHWESSTSYLSKREIKEKKREWRGKTDRESWKDEKPKKDWKTGEKCERYKRYDDKECVKWKKLGPK